MSSAAGYFGVAIATVVVIFADYLIKIAADRELSVGSWQFLLGGTLYGLSTIGWFIAMKSISLVHIGVAYSVFTILALSAMGVILFGESLHARETLGIGMAVVSLILMARVL